MSIEAITAFCGGVSSFLSGLLGIGGGIVLTPLLLYLPPALGAPALPVKIVTGLTIVQAISGSVMGSWRHYRYGNVSLRLVRVMGPAGGIASLAGALASRSTSDRVLLFIFATFALAGAITLVMPVRAQETTVDDLHVNVPLAVAIAVGIGFFGGMVGIGAIAFIIGALVYLLRVPVHFAIGTSLAIGSFSALAALVGKAATAQVDPLLGAIVFFAALVTAPLGAAVARRTNARVLLGVLAALVAVTSLRIYYQAFTGA